MSKNPKNKADLFGQDSVNNNSFPNYPEIDQILINQLEKISLLADILKRAQPGEELKILLSYYENIDTTQSVLEEAKVVRSKLEQESKGVAKILVETELDYAQVNIGATLEILYALAIKLKYFYKNLIILAEIIPHLEAVVRYYSSLSVGSVGEENKVAEERGVSAEDLTLDQPNLNYAEANESDLSATPEAIQQRKIEDERLVLEKLTEAEQIINSYQEELGNLRNREDELKAADISAMLIVVPQITEIRDIRRQVEDEFMKYQVYWYYTTNLSQQIPNMEEAIVEKFSSIIKLKSSLSEAEIKIKLNLEQKLNELKAAIDKCLPSKFDPPNHPLQVKIEKAQQKLEELKSQLRGLRQFLQVALLDLHINLKHGETIKAKIKLLSEMIE